MTGIYMITNIKNGKKYIGQSKRLMERWGEHLRSAQPEKYSSKGERDNKTSIHLAMQKYGAFNFTFQVLEFCSEDQLDERERYWTRCYDSYNNGYNETEGGQLTFAQKGEKHSQAKLNQKEVDEIKQCLRNGKNLEEISISFPKVSKSTLSMINQGKIWIEENEKYPIADLSHEQKRVGSSNGRAKMTEEEVMQIRRRYANGESASEIYKTYKDKISKSTLDAIAHGKTFKHLPYYKKSIKQWIEPCIDYPQSLK